MDLISRMERQGLKPKGKENRKPELAAIASVIALMPSASSPLTTSSPTLNLNTYVGDLSCAITEQSSSKDFAALLSASGGFASILNSGTSSHLLKDRDVFWTYKVTQAQPMKTANQGILQMKASGNCLVRLTLGNITTTIKLHDCLHAPSACVNLLSIGRMMAARSKLGCNMDDRKFVIVQKNPDRSRTNIYEGKQSGNLYFVDL